MWLEKKKGELAGMKSPSKYLRFFILACTGTQSGSPAGDRINPRLSISKT